MLEVAHQFDGQVARAGYAQMQSDVAVLGADGFQILDHHLSRQYGLQFFHGHCPGEAFVVEHVVQRHRLIKQLGVVRLAHHCLVTGAFLSDPGNLTVE